MSRAWTGILALLGSSEGQGTGDGRAIDAGAIYWDDDQAPWPLKWDRDEGDHSAPIVGEISRVWYDGDLLRGEGVLHDDSADEETLSAVNRVIELLEAEDGPVPGVSVELDSETVELRVDKVKWDQWQEEMEAWMDDEVPEPEEPEVKDGRVVIDTIKFNDWLEVLTEARFRGAAIVDNGAFADASISVAAAIALAASNSLSAITKAFANPMFGIDGNDDTRLVWQTPQRPEEIGGWGCPLTIEDDGTIYGHATLRFRCHGAFASCMPPPDHGGDLSNWLIGDATGTGIPTGPITLDTTHGVDDRGRIKSHDHLANTGVAVADVASGFDSHGMWVSGKLRPGVTDRELAALRGSTLSGEWHVIGGKQRCVGVLAVNSPGYLVQRRGIAASNGTEVLFTAGASCCEEELVLADKDRISILEDLVAGLVQESVNRSSVTRTEI